MYIYTCIHACIHTYTHTHTHAYICMSQRLEENTTINSVIYMRKRFTKKKADIEIMLTHADVC
jgi:hypothetical protein